jgi:hypothetical protein
MAKSKQGPALYDVLDEGAGRQRLQVPPWWSRGPDTLPRRRYEDAAVVEEGELEAAAPAAPTIRAGLRRTHGGVILTLTTPVAIGAVALLIVALVGAYSIGVGASRKVGAGMATDRAAPDPIDQARDAPAQPRLLGALQRRPDSGASNGAGLAGAPTGVDPDRSGGAGDSAPARVSAGPDAWVRGWTYIVVQEFLPRQEADAPLTQEFLREHGLETALVRLSSGSVQLITTEGYDANDAAGRKKGAALLSRVHELGRQYRKAGGRYHLQGYPKLMTGDRW